MHCFKTIVNTGIRRVFYEKPYKVETIAELRELGLRPVLLTGVYAISKRKDKIARQEQEDAVQNTKRLAAQEMDNQLSKLKDKMTREKETAVTNGVKKALADAEAAAKKAEQEREAQAAEAAEAAEKASPDEATTDETTTIDNAADPEPASDDSVKGEE